MNNVCAIIVTHNRLELLKNAINSIRNQLFKVTSIVVINNGSSDGTMEWLSTQVDIEYVNQENIGCSGGFKRGLELNIAKHFDWFWLLDDDTMVEKECLSKLLEFSNISKCIHPTKRYLDGSYLNWEQYLDVMHGQSIYLNNISFKNGKDFCFVNVGNFEGMLIHREVVDKIGFPDERFFIAGDDTIYGYLASKVTNVILVKEAILIRQKESVSNEKLTTFFLYYYFRNFHLIEEYLVKDFPEYRKTRRMNYNILLFRYTLVIIRDNRYKFMEKLDLIKSAFKGFFSR